MPRIDGARVYHTIRAQAPSLSILVTSGYAAPAVRSLLENDPRAAFVTKPWVIGKVLAALHQLRGRLKPSVCLRRCDGVASAVITG